MSISIPIDDTTILSRPSNLVASEIDGEMVILNVDNGYFFQLNRIGSRIWETLATPMTMAELCHAMQDKFDIDEETCRSDVAAFVGSLMGHDLVAVDNRAS